MIGKQTKGRSFGKLLNYLLGKPGAILIGGNMEGTTSQELAAEFRFSQQLNPSVSRAVYHTSLSLPHEEHLNNDQWRQITRNYLQAMGFDMNQYVIVRHTDRDHAHTHIVASRIRLDGTTVSDRWDYRRSEVVIRQLEQEYGLRSPDSSQEKDICIPTAGERRLLVRPDKDSIRAQLQRSIDQVIQVPLTLPQLIEQLQQNGIQVRICHDSAAEELDAVAFSGTHLGKAYRFRGLPKYRQANVDFTALQEPDLREEGQENDRARAVAKRPKRPMLPDQRQQDLEL